MKVIYDTELDKFVSNNLSNLTDDDLKSLSGMLGSRDRPEAPCQGQASVEQLALFRPYLSACRTVAVVFPA